MPHPTPVWLNAYRFKPILPNSELLLQSIINGDSPTELGRKYNVTSEAITVRFSRTPSLLNAYRNALRNNSERALINAVRVINSIPGDKVSIEQTKELQRAFGYIRDHHPELLRTKRIKTLIRKANMKMLQRSYRKRT